MPPPREQLRRARRIVVKIGSHALMDDRGLLDEAQVRSLVAQMAQLRHGGLEVICVSSGAVAAGLRELDLPRRPRDVPSLQAAAAIGQARLIALYRQCFAEHDLSVGQVLLIHDDVRSRVRHLNASNTLSYLLKRGAVPIVNENDTVAVDEIRFGDNDRLSALVACLIRADALLVLTTVDGLLASPPTMKHKGGEVIPLVERITPEVHALADGETTASGTGGMRTKLHAAEIATRAGLAAVIANARAKDVLPRIASGEEIGTLFTSDARGQPMRGRHRWIAFFERSQGALHLDAGAAKAVRERNSSLLAVGITRVEGHFDCGATVSVVDASGRIIARGLVNYPSESIERIRGCKSAQIRDILGSCEYEEIIHRDNMVPE
jgi:glutamate 5-kinase